MQGSIDPRTDKLSFIDTLPGWPRQGIRTHLETLLGLDVHIDNDANLAAIAERSEGAGAGTGSFALLWLGPGLGLAVDLAGAVHRGAAGGAGEIGYLPVPWDAVDIDPQAHDLQQLIGGPAAVAIARRHGVSGDTDGDVIAALSDHPAREGVFAEVARRIALGVVPGAGHPRPGTHRARRPDRHLPAGNCWPSWCGRRSNARPCGIHEPHNHSSPSTPSCAGHARSSYTRYDSTCSTNWTSE